ncbi:hypothetical protein ACFFUS_12225 [Vibrio gallaecicus]|uniref:hypothetical protein n=1 Tax=Vibrio gallaecicus TaxID=552386 RepID=UPI0010C93D1F|nr:hypothetical protein [Vibrio gallaecicus]MDN3617562.1 hypothetical protein [Vibrio gallaecicus]
MVAAQIPRIWSTLRRCLSLCRHSLNALNSANKLNVSHKLNVSNKLNIAGKINTDNKLNIINTISVRQLVLILFIIFFAVDVKGSQNELMDDEPLILELKLGRVILHDSFLAFSANDLLYVPLGEISERLRFPIEVDPFEGVATGWFMKESQRFKLDLKDHTAFVGSTNYTIEATDYRHEFDDLYISSRLLQQWFPIIFELEVSELTLHISSTEALPIEQQIARDKRAKDLNRSGYEQQAYPLIDFDYQWLSFPLVDVSLSSSIDSNREWQSDYSVLTTGDLAKLTSELYLAGSLSEPSITSSRWSLGRIDPVDTGILGTTEFQIGDVFTPNIDHLTSSSSGRGVYLSNRELGRASEFDRTTLRGMLINGWEVELYVNNQLIAMQSSRDRNDGLYEFEDVELVFGTNAIKLVFYGPEGQIEERYESVYIGDAQLSPGKWGYEFGVNQLDVPVIDLTTTDYVASDGEGEYQLGAKLSYGATRDVTLNMNTASVFDNSRRQQLFSIGANWAFWGMFNDFNILVDDGSNPAFNWQLQTQVLSTNINFKHLELRGFDSPSHEQGDNAVVRESEIRLDDRFGFLGLSLATTREEVEEKVGVGGRTDQYSFSQRISLSTSFVQITNELDYSLYYSREKNLDGGLAFSKRITDWSLRSGLDYELIPKHQLTSASLSASRRTEWGYYLGFGLDYDMDSNLTDYELTVSKVFENIDMSLNLSADSEGEYEVGLAMSFGLGYSTASSKLYMRADSLASSGALELRAFSDTNGNGVFDQEEQEIKGLQLTSGQTLQNGHTLISGLSNIRSRDIVIDETSLSDPYLVPNIAGASVLGRSGVFETFDYPIIATGEVDGDTYLLKDGEYTQVGGVVMQLINQQGIVIKESVSEYDGFFLMDKIPLGTYLLRVSPEQLSKLKLKPVLPVPVLLTNSGDFVGPVRIELITI